MTRRQTAADAIEPVALPITSFPRDQVLGRLAWIQTAPIDELKDEWRRLPDRTGQDIWEKKQRQKPPELTVAFLRFSIDGKPAKDVEWLTPGEAHDLEIEVRVSRWPEDAERLVIEPVTIERPGTFNLPEFVFSRPSGEGPHLFHQRGRMILNVRQGVQAKPFEFAFAAEFEPPSRDDAVSLAGQRRLRLDGSSSASPPLTGYPAIDARIWEIRGILRAMAAPEDDIASVLAALVTIGNLMGVSTQDAVFPKPILEKEFQAILRDRLRQNPLIGRDVDPEPHVAGGRADLSFRGMRIELKSEQYKRLEPADCKKFAAQAASYAVGTGRRAAILCVLDCSPKPNRLSRLKTASTSNPSYLAARLFSSLHAWYRVTSRARVRTRAEAASFRDQSSLHVGRDSKGCPECVKLGGPVPRDEKSAIARAPIHCRPSALGQFQTFRDALSGLRTL